MVAILTVLLGWAGYYRFHNKQYGLGLLYLLTGGVFCIGWFYDIYLSGKELLSEAKEEVKEKFIENLEDAPEEPDINDIHSPFVTKEGTFTIASDAIIINGEKIPYSECDNIHIICGGRFLIGSSNCCAKVSYRGERKVLEYTQLDAHRAAHAFEFANQRIFEAQGKSTPLFTFISYYGSELFVYDDYITIRFVRAVQGLADYAARKSGLNSDSSGTKEIFIGDLTAVQHEESRSCILDGSIQFAYAGSIEQKGIVTRNTNDENTILYSYERIEDVRRIVEYINKRRMELRRQQSAPAAAPSIPLSAADELRKYKELLDQGIITQEEFDAKKKQLLGL